MGHNFFDELDDIKYQKNKTWKELMSLTYY